jgi:hypothetical protein
MVPLFGSCGEPCVPGTVVGVRYIDEVPYAATELASNIADPMVRRAALSGLVPDFGRWVTAVEANPVAVRKVPAVWLGVLHLCLDAEISAAAAAADRRVVARSAFADAQADREFRRLTVDGIVGARLLVADSSVVEQAVGRDPALAVALIEAHFAGTAPLPARTADAVVNGWLDHRAMASSDDLGAEALIGRLLDARMSGALGLIDPAEETIVDAVTNAGRLDLVAEGPPLCAHAVTLLVSATPTPATLAGLLRSRGAASEVQGCPALVPAEDYRGHLRALLWDSMGDLVAVNCEIQKGQYFEHEWLPTIPHLSDDAVTMLVEHVVENFPGTIDRDAGLFLAGAARAGIHAGLSGAALRGQALTEFAESCSLDDLRVCVSRARVYELLELLTHFEAGVDPDGRWWEVLRHGVGLPPLFSDGQIDPAAVWGWCASRLGADPQRWALLWALIETWEGTLEELLDTVDACRSPDPTD